MHLAEATTIFLLLPLAAAGCGTSPGPEGGAPCEDTGSCEPTPPPESVCLEHLADFQADDGCGVFQSRDMGDDRNPGTREKPVQSLAHAVALARVGRGRVFACSTLYGVLTIPSGVDLLGGFSCFNHWKHHVGARTDIQPLPEGGTDNAPALTVEPASAGDTGAADGVSTIADMSLSGFAAPGVFARSGTAVEILRSRILGTARFGTRDGEDAPGGRAPDGANGRTGADGCAAVTVAGAAAAMTECDGGVSIGGKGGDGGVAEGGDGDDGAPLPMPNPRREGVGGVGERGEFRCGDGRDGVSGAAGANGVPGQGIGRISEAGWERGEGAGDGATGAPGQGGGGGGGLRGSLARCGTAARGGPSGGAGGAGGCGGKGGKGGSNGSSSIGILALHARVTIRDTEVAASHPARGGQGGYPQAGGFPGTGFSGGRWPDRSDRACDGGDGGYGGRGGYGGNGRGGDAIGIAYLDEDQLVLEGVTFELAPPGKGGSTPP